MLVIGSILFFFLVIKLESFIPINFLDKAERTFNDLGDTVQVRTNSSSRLYRTKGKLVKKSDVVRIQKAGCISLFTKSNNAIDITVHPTNRILVFEAAKTMFKGAKIVEIDMDS